MTFPGPDGRSNGRGLVSCPPDRMFDFLPRTILSDAGKSCLKGDHVSPFYSNQPRKITHDAH